MPIIKIIPGLSYTITGNLVMAAKALEEAKDLLRKFLERGAVRSVVPVKFCKLVSC